MSVYLMTEAVVHDVEAYEKYKEQAPQYVARQLDEIKGYAHEFVALVHQQQSTQELHHPFERHQ